ncbi:hypothetical protein KP509_1Z138000 [Ceratopteris richardii]|nr:hypothetical protein KP509_1Z138000 [Ceratopteris richardii]
MNCPKPRFMPILIPAFPTLAITIFTTSALSSKTSIPAPPGRFASLAHAAITERAEVHSAADAFSGCIHRLPVAVAEGICHKFLLFPKFFSSLLRQTTHPEAHVFAQEFLCRRSCAFANCNKNNKSRRRARRRY